MNVLRRKPIELSLADTEEPEHRLRKDLGLRDLLAFGIGIIIGSGIFVLTGQQAARNAGPAVVFSFVAAATVSAFAGLCYAELASTVPVAGSAYTYSYTTLGELIAWIIGWDLILEFGLGAAVVARGWSSYLQKLFHLPMSIFGDSADVDLGAVMITLLLAVIAVIGVKESARATSLFVVVKIAVCLFVIALGLTYVKTSNWHPFIPKAVPQSSGHAGLNTPLWQLITGTTPSKFGIYGIFAAASIVFFSYTGFEAVSTVAEETKNPQRNLPLGILGALGVCTLLYVGVAGVITGMVPFPKLDTAAPLADAFKLRGVDYASTLISIGAICGITSVILVDIQTQTRIGFAMARDGLLPRAMAKVHPKFGTPYRLTVLIATLVVVLGAFIPLADLSEMVSIGTLAAFCVVAIGVLILRRTDPDRPRKFRAPALPLITVLTVAGCLWLMLNLAAATWLRFVVWLAVGFVIYFGYGVKNSRMAKVDEEPVLSGKPS